ATLGFCRSVVRLAEFHDVDAVLTKRGADRGCRVSGARLDLQLDQTGDLLLGRHVRSLLFSSVTRTTLVRVGFRHTPPMRGGSNSTSIPRLNVRRRIPERNRTPDVRRCLSAAEAAMSTAGGREDVGGLRTGVSDLGHLVEPELDGDVPLEDRQE